jgi:hypothetical protein
LLLWSRDRGIIDDLLTRGSWFGDFNQVNNFARSILAKLTYRLIVCSRAVRITSPIRVPPAWGLFVYKYQSDRPDEFLDGSTICGAGHHSVSAQNLGNMDRQNPSQFILNSMGWFMRKTPSLLGASLALIWVESTVSGVLAPLEPPPPDSVFFLIGTNVLKTSIERPYSVTVTNLSEGEYNVRALPGPIDFISDCPRDIVIRVAKVSVSGCGSYTNISRGVWVSTR